MTKKWVATVMTLAGFWRLTALGDCGGWEDRFTPWHLTKESELILVVDVQQGASKTNTVLTVRQILKGKTEDKTLDLDLSRARDEGQAETLRKLAPSDQPALFFVGGYEDLKRGLLHIQGYWASCDYHEGLWRYDCIDNNLLSVWNGGTDMLRRAVTYALEDDAANFWITEGVSWSPDPQKAATLDGAIKSVRPVDLSGDGKLALFVARDKGDQLFACERGARKLVNITAERELESKSLVYAWGSFAGQQRLDLISYDGKTATLFAQQADRKFKSNPLDLGKALAGGCISLTALDVGAKERAGLVVGGSGLPVIVALDEKGKATCTALTAPGIDLAKLGTAGVCLVADFDGDAIADILAVRQDGGILFRGAAPGKFKPGEVSAVKCRDAVAGVCVGDLDGDGGLDVLVAGGAARFMWINDGKGNFAQRFSAVGEMMTHDLTLLVADCMVGDVNNDGRQDVLWTYATNAAPVTYYSRGFLSFGHSHSIDISEMHFLPDANNARDGAQSACLADLDGDGAQDMALALVNGDIWCLFQSTDDNKAPVVVAEVPLASEYKGPVTCTGWVGKRCLGAWNAMPGTSPGWFGGQEDGPVTITWRLPGGRPQSSTVYLKEPGVGRVELK